MNPRALLQRPRRVLPVLALLIAAVAAVLITSTGAVAQGSCQSSTGAAPRAAATLNAQSQPCAAFGVGTVQLLSIRQGDASQIFVSSSDPNASLFVTVNEDPGITCLYHRRAYVGLTEDQYRLVVNNGSTLNEPTLTITIGSAVPGGLFGAQLAILTGRAQVCFGSPKPFTPKAGSVLTTSTTDPRDRIQYVGLLRDCGLLSRGRGQPCIVSRSAAQIPVNGTPTGVVNITFTVPPGFDPRMHS